MIAIETTAGVAYQEFRYNSLGYRTGWHYDVDGDGTVEGTSDDQWFHFAYDDNWRIAMTFRANDSEPKESFVYHNPGAGVGRLLTCSSRVIRTRTTLSSSRVTAICVKQRKIRLFLFMGCNWEYDPFGCNSNWHTNRFGSCVLGYHEARFPEPDNDVNATGWSDCDRVANYQCT